MKSIVSILIALVLSNVAYSQDCATLLKKTEDKFNERTLIESANPFTIKADDIRLGIRLVSLERGHCAMSFGFGSGWVQGGEPIVFIMEDGERIKLTNATKVNFDGMYRCTIQTYLDIPETKKAFESLTTKKMTSMKVDFFEADLTPEESQKIFDLMLCLKSENVRD